jgi:hypothetical protein
VAGRIELRLSSALAEDPDVNAGAKSPYWRKRDEAEGYAVKQDSSHVQAGEEPGAAAAIRIMGG